MYDAYEVNLLRRPLLNWNKIISKKEIFYKYIDKFYVRFYGLQAFKVVTKKLTVQKMGDELLKYSLHYAFV